MLEKNIIVTEVCPMDAKCKISKVETVSGRPFHSISLRKSGRVRFQCGEMWVESKAGDITFMPAGAAYRTEVTEESELLVIHFKTLAPLESPPFFAEVGNNAELKELFATLCGGAEGYRCFSLFYSLLAVLDRPLVPKRMRSAKEHIDRCYAEPLTIADLAAEAGISEVHFRKEFKKYFGTAPLAYLKGVRLDRAAELLLSGEFSVAEVAMRCGFDSISYFSYEFRRLKGISPAAYQKALI